MSDNNVKILLFANCQIALLNEVPSFELDETAKNTFVYLYTFLLFVK